MHNGTGALMTTKLTTGVNVRCERPRSYGSCEYESVRTCQGCGRSLCYEHYIFHNDDKEYMRKDGPLYVEIKLDLVRLNS